MSKLNAKWLQFNTSSLVNNGGSLEVNFNDGGQATDEIWSSDQTKSYVDSVAQGLSTKDSCRAATDGALAACTYANGTAGVGATLTADANGALANQDGIALSVSDRLLVKDQAAPLQNGIYVVTDLGNAGSPFILTRSVDSDDNMEGGNYTFIQEGTANSDSGWVLTSDGTITVGTTGIVWAQFSGAGAIVSGTGLTKSGGTIQIGDGTTGDINGINRAAGEISVATGAGLEVSGNQVRVAAAAAGNGLAGGAGSPLSVNVGTGLEINADTVRMAAASGAGLTGGGATVLAVDPAALITGGTAEVDADQLDIDYTPTNYTPTTTPTEVTSVDHLSAHLAGINAALASITGTIDGDTIEIDWNPSNYTPATTPAEVTTIDQLTAHLYGIDQELNTVATAVRTAGNGLVDNGIALDVNVSTGLELSGDAVRMAAASGAGLTGGGATVLAVDPTALITGGTAEVDGDQIDIDFTPSNYTPATTPAEVTSVDHLSAHLYGIDQQLAAATGENAKQEMHVITAGENTAGFFSLSESPINAQSVQVSVVDGVPQCNKQTIGTSGATGDFDVLSTTELHFNNSGAATALSEDISTGDILIINYVY